MLKKPRLSSRVKGTLYFWYADEIGGYFKRQEEKRRDPFLMRMHKFVCMRSTSFHSRPKQFKGCFAMVLAEDLKWKLVIVDRLTKNRLMGWYALRWNTMAV